MTTALEVHSVALTHRGRVRELNEDAIAVGHWVCSSTSMDQPRVAVERLEAEWLLCLVADGLGGHQAGEVASALAATRLMEETPRLADEAAVATCLGRINDELFDRMAREPPTLGMGTTVAGLLVGQDQVLFFNVGDSRVYREDEGFLRQLSVDDIPHASTLSLETIARPRGSTAITQSLGGAANRTPVAPHVGRELTRPGHRYLLCSDGLTDSLDLDTIEGCLRVDDRSAARTLFDRAMRAGGRDNISIVIARIVEADAGFLPPHGEADHG